MPSTRRHRKTNAIRARQRQSGRSTPADNLELTTLGAQTRLPATGPSFKARYPGRCSACGFHYSKATRINPVDGGYAHTVCTNPPN